MGEYSEQTSDGRYGEEIWGRISGEGYSEGTSRGGYGEELYEEGYGDEWYGFEVYESCDKESYPRPKDEENQYPLPQNNEDPYPWLNDTNFDNCGGHMRSSKSSLIVTYLSLMFTCETMVSQPLQ